MTTSELLKSVLDGRFLVAVEVRGARVEPRRVLDKKSGLARGSVQITYIVERLLQSGIDVIKIVQRLPDAITEAGQVLVNIGKGQRCVFELEAMNFENGMVSTWTRFEPVPLEEEAQGIGGGLPVAGFSQPSASAPNLVLTQTTPQEPK